MNFSAFLQLCVATSLFIGAASSAKVWSLSPSFGRVIFTMMLYVAGNLLMMHLLRQIGMATAFSITAVLQLIAINLVAIFVFGERVGFTEGTGIVLAIAGVALITFAPQAGQ
jgi:multidrug transporter EmrE-like cation transporter